MGNSLESSIDSNLSKSKRLWIAAILGTLAAFGPLSIDMYLPALPDLANDFHTSPSFVQLSLTFFLLGLSSGQCIGFAWGDFVGFWRNCCAACRNGW